MRISVRTGPVVNMYGVHFIVPEKIELTDVRFRSNSAAQLNSVQMELRLGVFANNFFVPRRNFTQL